MLQSLRNLFSQPKPLPTPLPTPPSASQHEEESEPVVTEISAAELRLRRAGDNPPTVLDVRELYEWQQVRMPDSLHIPMNDVPHRLDDLPRGRPLVVMCAHGIRSYGVTAYLVGRGYQAVNLTGGITQWAIQGGAVEQGRP